MRPIRLARLSICFVAPALMGGCFWRGCIMFEDVQPKLVNDSGTDVIVEFSQPVSHKSEHAEFTLAPHGVFEHDTILVNPHSPDPFPFATIRPAGSTDPAHTLRVVFDRPRLHYRLVTTEGELRAIPFEEPINAATTAP